MTTEAPPPDLDPADYMLDARGRWVPKRLVRPVDIARHDLVLELARAAIEKSAELAAFKKRAMQDIRAFVQLSAEQYNVRLSGAKGNVSLVSYDGRYKIVRATADRLVFDERLQVAKQLIDQCIREWSEGSSDELLALVNDAFQVDKQGEVSTSRVLGLRHHNIDHPKWKEAMRAIADSVHVAETRAYLRFYVRNDETGEYDPISLDLSSVGGSS